MRWLLSLLFSACSGLSTPTHAKTWTTAAPMPTARSAPATGVIEGKLYVVGGYDGTNCLKMLDVYNAATNTWGTESAMPTARSAPAAGAIDGKLYVVGGVGSSGNNLNTLEVYNPATNTWVTKAAMPTARCYLTAGVIDGRLYVVGGHDGHNPLNTLEVYNPATNTWETKTAMPTARYNLAAGVIDGKLYVVGGYGSGYYNNTLEVYDPATDTWATKAVMPTARGYLAAGAIDGWLYVVGGYGSGGYKNTLEVYNPATNTWETKSAMPTAREGLAAGVIDGRLYVVGGWNGRSLNMLEVMAPATLSGASPPLPRLTAPPSLSVTASFEEPSGNRALDAYEEAALVLRVRNAGRGPASRLRAAVTGRAAGVTVSPSETMAILQPNAEATLRIALKADGRVRDGTFRLRAVVEEARGFSTDTVAVEFETRAERPPALSLVRVALDDDQTGQSYGNNDNVFQTGETAELTLFVQNTGTGAAEGVTGTVSTSAQYVYVLSPSDGRFTVGDIPPGEFREVPVVVTVAPAYRGSNTLPITLTLADRRPRYAWANLPLGLALGARTATVQTVRVQAAAERSAGLVQLPPELRASGSASSASGPDTSFSVAVLPLDCPGMNANAAATLTDHLRLALHQTGVFKVMERARMEAILQEQSFALSPCTSTSCAIEVGELLAAPFIVTGRVGKVGDTWSVSLNLVDVETSHIPAMASQMCSGCELGRLLQDSVPQAAAALAGDMLRATARGR